MAGTKKLSDRVIATVLQYRRIGNTNLTVATHLNKTGEVKHPDGKWLPSQIAYIYNKYKEFPEYKDGTPGADPNHWPDEEPELRPRAPKPENPMSITNSPKIRPGEFVSSRSKRAAARHNEAAVHHDDSNTPRIRMIGTRKPDISDAEDHLWPDDMQVDEPATPYFGLAGQAQIDTTQQSPSQGNRFGNRVWSQAFSQSQNNEIGQTFGTQLSTGNAGMLQNVRNQTSAATVESSQSFNHGNAAHMVDNTGLHMSYNDMALGDEFSEVDSAPLEGANPDAELLGFPTAGLAGAGYLNHGNQLNQVTALQSTNYGPRSTYPPINNVISSSSSAMGMPAGSQQSTFQQQQRGQNVQSGWQNGMGPTPPYMTPQYVATVQQQQRALNQNFENIDPTTRSTQNLWNSVLPQYAQANVQAGSLMHAYTPNNMQRIDRAGEGQSQTARPYSNSQNQVANSSIHSRDLATEISRTTNIPRMAVSAQLKAQEAMRELLQELSIHDSDKLRIGTPHSAPRTNTIARQGPIREHATVVNQGSRSGSGFAAPVNRLRQPTASRTIHSGSNAHMPLPSGNRAMNPNFNRQVVMPQLVNTYHQANYNMSGINQGSPACGYMNNLASPMPAAGGIQYAQNNFGTSPKLGHPSQIPHASGYNHFQNGHNGQSQAHGSNLALSGAGSNTGGGPMGRNPSNFPSPQKSRTSSVSSRTLSARDASAMTPSRYARNTSSSASDVTGRSTPHSGGGVPTTTRVMESSSLAPRLMTAQYTSPAADSGQMNAAQGLIQSEVTDSPGVVPPAPQVSQENSHPAVRGHSAMHQAIDANNPLNVTLSLGLDVTDMNELLGRDMDTTTMPTNNNPATTTDNEDLNTFDFGSPCTPNEGEVQEMSSEEEAGEDIAAIEDDFNQAMAVHELNQAVPVQEDQGRASNSRERPLWEAYNWSAMREGKNTADLAGQQKDTDVSGEGGVSSRGDAQLFLD